MKTCKKIRYTDIQTAIDKAKNIPPRVKGEKFTPYLCTKCNVYHLTSKTPKEQGKLKSRMFKNKMINKFDKEDYYNEIYKQ